MVKVRVRVRVGDRVRVRVRVRPGVRVWLGVWVRVRVCAHLGQRKEQCVQTCRSPVLVAIVHGSQLSASTSLERSLSFTPIEGNFQGGRFAYLSSPGPGCPQLEVWSAEV